MNKLVSKREQAVIEGNLEALKQALAVLAGLTQVQYCHVASPYVESTIGQHFRHLADMFWAVLASDDSGVIDYDIRRRGADIENSKAAAVDEIQRILEWMQQLQTSNRRLNTAVVVKTEVKLTSTESVEITSTLERELIFASSHAVHHFALIAMIAKLQGADVPKSAGLAPATASFIREQKRAVNI